MRARAFAIATIAAAALTLGACSNDDDTTPAEETPAADAAAPAMDAAPPAMDAAPPAMDAAPPAMDAAPPAAEPAPAAPAAPAP